MMNECEGADRLVGAWEEGRAPDAEALEGLEAHLRSCPRCRGRHSPLLPLLRREAGAGVGKREASAAALALADAVMGRLGEERRPRIPLRLPPRRRLLFPAAAAAALLVAVFAALAPRLAPPTGRVLVRFVIVEPKASSVQLVGDFTGWKPEGHELRPDASGRVWEISVPLERGRVYLYNFVVDGERWTVDPAALEKVDDGFGGSSALLRL